MKKYILTFLLLVLFFAPVLTIAQGLVPCGQGLPTDPNFKRCELEDLFKLIQIIYKFLVWNIATPLAGLIIVIGGIMLIISAGNPGLANQAKKIIMNSIVAWLLVFGSWLIINTVLNVIGYIGPR